VFTVKSATPSVWGKDVWSKKFAFMVFTNKHQSDTDINNYNSRLNNLSTQITQIKFSIPVEVLSR
jgi:hypothetical protein